ncbi:MAG: T9SS type A sorting domain-containing protein, partial [Ignavibacteria bacterium]|nr:T9SS type A sorting domain-containing protein [Ignavibacteria bacterium]
PVTKSGFIDGILNPAGDRFIQINSGPFNMAPGDTQEVIFAQIVTSSTSRLGSISYLKYLAKYVKDFYMNGMFAKTTDVEKENELPTLFSLEQNYPNPFNPETTIRYTIPKSSQVTLKVYDVLGREVTTLVDEFKQAGKYYSQFSILNSSPRSTRVGAGQLSSGVYFYILQAGEYISTKKMVLLK